MDIIGGKNKDVFSVSIKCTYKNGKTYLKPELVNNYLKTKSKHYLSKKLKKYQELVYGIFDGNYKDLVTNIKISDDNIVTFKVHGCKEYKDSKTIKKIIKEFKLVNNTDSVDSLTHNDKLYLLSLSKISVEKQ